MAKVKFQAKPKPTPKPAGTRKAPDRGAFDFGANVQRKGRKGGFGGGS